MTKSVNVFALALLACGALAFAAGWGASRLSAPAVAVPVSAPAESDAVADGLSRFKAIDWNMPQPAGAGELALALPSNAALRMAVLERYRQEPAGLAKENLAELLTAQPLPEVISAAVGWAQQSDSAMARADGFNILKRVPPQSATYGLVRQALEHEKDPVALGAAVWAMMPLQSIPDPAEVAQVAPRLHALTRHPMANVRSASIQRLAQWDRARQYIERDVLRVLSDPDGEVRIAAIGASSIAVLTSDSVKQRLFAMLASAKDDDELRSIILLQFDRFGLSRQEYATYQAVQHQLFGGADAPLKR